MTGKVLVLSCNIFLPLELEGDCELRFTDFTTHNSIPNVKAVVNNLFYYSEKDEIILRTGSYEIDYINNYIQEYVDREER